MMQPMNSTTKYRETALSQRGSAEVHTTVGAPVKQLDKYVFPGSNPERQRVRRVVANVTKVTESPDAIREQQIISATENAFNQFQQRERELTPEEVSAYAAWILQADSVLESMRLSAEKGE